VERVDLTTRLRTQQSQVEEIQASLAAARSSYESKKRLNERNQIVTERTLEEAEAKVKAEEARLAAAIDTVTLIEKALSGGSSGEPWPLTVPRGGQVVQVAIQPGELVEAGQIILQLQRFDELIARVGLPTSASLQRSPRLARIEVIGQESALLDAEFVGPSPSLESKTLGQSLLYRVRVTDSQLRPGAAVKAQIPVDGKALTGVVVPTEAIERYLGKSWVYMQTGDETFVRREVSASYPAAEGWFVTNGVAAGDRVVISGSQTLLSEEFKSQIQTLGEGEGQ
jgi:RND family efflux transporter MFP subunit